MNNNGMINSLVGKFKRIQIQWNVKSMIYLTLSMQVFSASIVFAKVGDENTQLLIKFKEQSSTPQIMHIQGTKKIIINFDNASELKYPIDSKSNKLIKDVITQKNGNKVRIAIDTFRPVSYSINKNIGDTFVVNLEENQVFQEKENNIIDRKELNNPILTSKNIIPIPIKVATQTINSIQEAELEHINIKANGKNAKVTLDLNDNSIVPNIVQTGNLLIIDLPNVKVPEEFQKNTIMSNLGTIVQNIDIAMQKGSGRIVLSQNDTWSYSTYQMDKKFVIEIKPMRDTEKEIYKGKPLTLNFQNMDVRAILQAIADFTNLNIMSSDSITGAMTIRLKDVPWDQALDLILEAKNLQKQKQGNVIWVATRQEITDKNKSQLELNNQANELAPLKLEFIQLNHYKAKEMKEVLEGKTGGGDSSGEKGGSTFALPCFCF